VTETSDKVRSSQNSVQIWMRLKTLGKYLIPARQLVQLLTFPTIQKRSELKTNLGQKLFEIMLIQLTALRPKPQLQLMSYSAR